ncbi:MAG: NAD(P)H-hydrate dehydratase [Lachnospira sp.]|nr:NAD(P)H-hydrate dehydratase [Lachnospira sp.]
MKYILDAVQSKEVDRFSIEEVGIPSLVLMERAALSVTEAVEEFLRTEVEQKTSFAGETRWIQNVFGKFHVLCICGSGNNGADGLAVARQLSQKGINVSVYFASGIEKKGTEEYEVQKRIVQNMNIAVEESYECGKYDVVVDAIFGIGLSREITGSYAKLIEQMNLDDTKVVAVDIPSGVNASTGHICGAAVRADMTVTFGYLKRGLVLYPGASLTGNTVVADIGFAADVSRLQDIVAACEYKDLQQIPVRKVDGNKGTFGKVLVAAGSKNMGGAAIFSGLAAYRCGCGLVKLLTHEENHDAVLKHLPEALMTLYTEELSDNLRKEQIKKDCQWATCIVLGPGIETDHTAKTLVETVLNDTEVPVILDADGLNVIAEQQRCGYAKGRDVIVTPHMGEMSRLTGMSIQELKENPIQAAKEYAKQEGVICVLKDARTIVTDGTSVYINLSGSDALATGGSGDVLTGVIAGMISAGLPLLEAAAVGCFVHGLAGEIAGRELGNRSVNATDIANAVGKVLK